MAIIKVQSWFRQRGRSWSELFYMSAADATAAVAAYSSRYGDRAIMLAQDVFYDRVIYSQVDPIGGDIITDTDVRTKAVQILPGDVTSNAVVIAAKVAASAQRQMTFRGFPDDWIKRQDVGGALFMVPECKAKMDAYLNTIFTMGIFINYKVKAADRSDRFPVDGFQAVSGEPRQTDVVARDWEDLVGDVGSKVQIGGCKGNARAANGVHVVRGFIVAGTFRIPLVFGRVSNLRFNDVAKAYGRAVSKAFAKVDGFGIYRVRSRKSGKIKFRKKGHITR